MAAGADRGGRATRVLVLGGTGMLGHVLWRTCRERLDAYATVRGDELGGTAAGVLDPERTVTGVRVEEPRSIARALDETGADAVVNCIGVVKQAVDDPAVAIRVNALFPHQLATACRERGARLIHVSTDCVFSGRKGGYTEGDPPDPADLYGRSKLLGEPASPGALTIRTSMIGREISTSHGLLEWFLSQSGATVRGFTRAVFTGPTTPVLSRAIADVLAGRASPEALWHVGAAPIDKHRLLLLLRDAFDVDVEIEPDDTVVIDRSLDSSRFRESSWWTAPSWEEMVAELAESAEHYANLRRGLARR
jgi:dTDP-4-dehydrorhamnose reductase